MNTQTQVREFWSLVASGKSAALDIHVGTGELVLRHTVSIIGERGNGATPAPYGSSWARIVESVKGEIACLP